MNTPTTDIQVKDLMTRNVITIRQDAPAIEVARLLITHRIGGVPVLDSNEHLIGMITISDLYLKEESIAHTRYTFQSLFNMPVFPSILSELYASRLSKVCAANIMRRNVVWISESDSLDEAIRRIHQHKVNRLPVRDATQERDNRLTGIVTRSDIIRHLISRPDVLSNLDMNLRSFSSV